jgi:cbb3-type cytochrome oxidase subunit 3
MNHVLHEGAEVARMGWLMGFTTVGFLGSMVLWTLWAYAPWNRQHLEEAAQLPLREVSGE